MNIAILNEVFLQPEHIEQLKQIGDVRLYEHSDTEEKVTERAKGAEIIIADCWEAPLNREVFEDMIDTKIVCIGSTGYDLVDTSAAKERGILVANVPGFSTEAVAEHTFALMLAAVRHIVPSDASMRQNPYAVDPSSAEHKKYLGTDLRDKTLGLIGLGSIGQRVAEIGRAFGMQVVAYNRTPRDIQGIEQLRLEDLLKQSDVVSLHMAMNSETKGIINKDTLAQMKPTAYLINTARSGLINELDLVDALHRGVIAGAGLDVVVDMTPESPLISLDNVVMTPHTAFFTNEALENVADIIVANVKAYVAGSPASIVT